MSDRVMTEGKTRAVLLAVGEARRKYLQLGVEVMQVDDERIRSNLEHTHSKLGIALEEAFGSLWRRDD